MEKTNDMICELLMDLAKTSELETIEVFALKYRLSNDDYGLIKDILYECLYNDTGYLPTYQRLCDDVKTVKWNKDKYNELLHSFQQKFILHDMEDGMLCKNLNQWMEENK